MTEPRSWTLPILMYHAIPRVERECSSSIDIPSATFRRQLETLTADGWELMSLSAALAAVSSGRPRVVALTIDDAYTDCRDAVMTVASMGGGCTVYVPTDHVEGLRHGSKALSHGPLGWKGLRELAQMRGVELGSHSCSHRPLDVLPTDTIGRELRESRRQLSERTGAVVTSLCYPYGYSSKRVESLAAAAGYENACVIGRRIARSSDRVFALPRVQPLGSTSPSRLRDLVHSGEPGLAPSLKRLAYPAWRGVRFAAARMGVNLT